MNHIRTQTAEYSRQHPEMPISYAGGYALSTEFEDCDIRELFRHADQNMYIDKNRAKMEEAAAERKISLEALDVVKKKGYHFSQLYLLQCKTGPVPDSACRFGLFPCRGRQLYRCGRAYCAGNHG